MNGLVEGMNTGRWMAFPHQSPYASVRQWLIANPGVPVATVVKAVSDHCHVFGYTALLSYSPKKQCPKCAQGLYHTELYDYPWLQRCPIHGHTLVTRCPECDSPWPMVSQIRSGSCPMCGIPAWDRLTERITIDECRFRCVETLLAFLDAAPSSFSFSAQDIPIIDLAGAYLWESMYRYSWPTSVTLNTAAFPAFQLALCPHFNRDELEQLGVVVPSFKLDCLKTPLRAYTRPPPPVDTWHSHLRRRGPLRHPPAEAMKTIQLCLGQILSWIENHSEADHCLRLGDYRQSCFDDLLERQAQPCPYCLSFSCWWEAITQKYFCPWQGSTPWHYLFARTLRWTAWPDAADRQLVMDDEEHYWRPNRQFETRFFERSLLLLFAELYQFAVFLGERLEFAGHNAFDRWSGENHYPAGAFLSSHCLGAFTTDREFALYWPDLNPLRELTPPPVSSKRQICGQGLGNPVEQTIWRPGCCTGASVEAFRKQFIHIGEAFHTNASTIESRRGTWGMLERASWLPGPQYSTRK